VIRGDAATPGWLGERLGYVGPTHPAIRSYVAAPHDLTPRRMSDVAGDREWHASPAYEECFSAFGAARQLSLVTSVDPQGIGTGWTLTRSGRDFTAAELALACRLAPVLLAVERRHAFVPTPSYPITEREREVLGLLADGLTAAAIGRRCGITERTARKHLTAIYAKLGCQDRLVAVSLARSSGLLPR
jgi:DNA-binding CsgD family transcriptional regulator